MRAEIRRLSPGETAQVIHENRYYLNEGFDMDAMEKCIAATSATWIGLASDGIICMYGIIPPTLLSDQCYLWLYTTELMKGNEFIFTRHSQRVIEDILKDYPEIIGHVRVGQERSVRWLRWLGAEFDEPEGIFIPFKIRKKQDG